MEQRDLLKDQIEQLGNALTKILSDFLGMSSKGQTSKAIEIANESFQNQLDIDIQKVLTLSATDLMKYLQDRNLTADHIEIIADYLKASGTAELEEDKQKIQLKLDKALELLQIADDVSQAVSFSRIQKKKEIQELLNS
tara:strand:- start:79 stop:495 length:417 start_codon:yes stop_codon:yes gene_type:complete